MEPTSRKGSLLTHLPTRGCRISGRKPTLAASGYEVWRQIPAHAFVRAKDYIVLVEPYSPRQNLSLYGLSREENDHANATANPKYSEAWLLG